MGVWAKSEFGAGTTVPTADPETYLEVLSASWGSRGLWLTVGEQGH